MTQEFFKQLQKGFGLFVSFLLAMHSSASMLKQMFVQPTPPLHTAVARAKSQYVTPFIAMYYVVHSKYLLHLALHRPHARYIIILY